MKKLYILGALLLSFSAAKAQYTVTFESDTEDVGGTVHNITLAPGGISEVHFYLHNETGEDQSVRVQRLKINEQSAIENQLCWGPQPDDSFEGICYPSGNLATNTFTSNPATIPASGKGELKPKFEMGSTETYGHYRYFFRVGATVVDSVDIFVNQSVMGIKPSQVKEEFSMNAYPNPASDMLTVTATGSGTYSVKITDVLGKVVYRDEMTSPKYISTSDFKNGVYLLTLTEKNKPVQTVRIVVKH